MRRSKWVKRLALSIVLVMTMSFGVNQGTIVSEAATSTYYPVEIDDVLTNPYMGWVPAATKTNWQQPHTMVYAALLWSDLEPNAKGEYDWEGFESRNNFDYWESQGVKINIRFYMDLPTSSSHMDIPQWLYDSMGSDKGDFYDCSIGKGFSPNYSDPVLIAEHERVIAALGERYNDDPNIAFIQLGSLGHWGEWHCWPYSESDGGPSGEFPAESVSNQYISHYVQSFSSDKLTMRRTTQMAKDNGMGLFNDMFGDVSSAEASGWGWLWGIENGYTDDLGQSQPAMPNFWQEGPSGGEFANGNSALYLTDSTISETIRLAQITHTSWLGPCCPASLEYGGTYQDNIDALAKTMGYRFVIKSISHATTATPGSTVAVNMDWRNRGVAPFYFQWSLKIGLANENGIVTYTTVSQDIREWLPGSFAFDTELIIPDTVKAGEYTVVAAIIDPATKKPGINLAIEGKRDDGWYELDTITIVESDPSSDAETSTSSIEVDGNASDWSGVSSIATASGQTATSLKVYDDSDYVYVCVNGSGIGSNSQVYLDVDGSTSTGYTCSAFSGMDYMIESGKLYSHPDNSNSWSWTGLGSTGITVVNNGSVYEAKIAKSLLAGLGSEIGIGFKDINSSWSSVCSLYGMGTIKASSIEVSVDGSASEWSGVDAVATASGQTATSLKVYDDSEYIYVCVQGSGLGTNGQLYIDADASASTGYKDSVWTGAGMDYMIESGKLYSHPDNSNAWSWTGKGSSGVTVGKNADVWEYRISKAALDNLGSSVGLGFKDINSSWSCVCRITTDTKCVYKLQK